MGNVFSIKNSKVEASAQNINRIDREIQQIKRSTKSVQNELRRQRGLESCVARIERITSDIDEEIKGMQSMHNSLEKISRCYEDAEKTITEHSAKVKGKRSQTSSSGKERMQTLILGPIILKPNQLLGPPKKKKKETHIDSIVFDKKGDYGGDQGAPVSRWGFWSQKKELYKKVREYYPDMTDKEIKKYLKKLNSEGCGDLSLANSLFMKYEGKEKEFEKDFGFPMYYKGDLNYDMLLVDLYCATDNHYSDRQGKDYVKDEDVSDEEGLGTSSYSRYYRMNKYLDDKDAGLEMDMEYYEKDTITPDNVMEYTKDGTVMISYHYGYLQDKNGKRVHAINGGHSMVVTGVTDDGRYIVSSWGDKYYIDPKESVSMRDEDGNLNTTDFSFDYVQYKEK